MDAILVATPVTLTFTLDNSQSALDATGLAFTDNLPNAMQVATPPNAQNTCSGTLSADAGATTISYSGGTVSAESSCTVSVDVVSPVPGSYENLTGALNSNLGNSVPASATLTVLPVDIFVDQFED